MKYKEFIYYHLTLLRDKPYLPQFIINFIDWLRYEVFYD
jgi:hypothetical protein